MKRPRRTDPVSALLPRPGRAPAPEAWPALLDVLLGVALAAALTGALTALPGGLGGVAPWLILLAAVFAARGAVAWLGLVLAARTARAAKSALRRRVLAVLLDQPDAAGLMAGEGASLAVDDVEALDGWIVRYAPARLAAGVGPVIVLAAAALASPIGAALLLATLIPFVAVMVLAGGAAADASRRQLDALARLSGLFSDRVRALPLVLAFQGEARETGRIAGAAREAGERTLGVLRVAFISTAALEFFAALSVALVAVYAGFSLLGLLPFKVPETLTFARAFFVLAVAPEFYGPMRRLAAAYHEKQLGEAAAARLGELLATPAAPQATHATILVPPAIVFDAVSAGFADDPDLMIGPVSLDLPAGGIAAFMGATGAGKSTLLKLLIGQARLASGDVRVAGEGLAEAGSFAPSIAWSGQAPILLPGSIGENIALAQPDAAPEAIAQVARAVGLGPALAARPGGLAALIDERGSGLSGGERRRIGLARALLRPSSILILDEPTADLDAESERAVLAAIVAASANRTVLIATHSEQVAALADRVVRL